MPPNTVYVGRPTKWGNSYKVGELSDDNRCPSTRERAVVFYKELIDRIGLDERALVKLQLKGKNLACWCPLDQPCHADVLLKIANES